MTSIGPRLVCLCVVGALLLSFPILAVFNRPVLVGGIPVLYLYLFGLWIAGIVTVFLIVRAPPDRDPGGPAPVPRAEAGRGREGPRC
jgi:hypothetical protein